MRILVVKKMRRRALEYASGADLRGLARAATDVIERLEEHKRRLHSSVLAESL